MKKIKISIDTYPSDKILYDLIVSQKMAKTKLQRFLRSRGIFSTTEDIRDLASLITSIVLDEKDFRDLISFTNVKENRYKSTSYQFSSKASLDAIVGKLTDLKLSASSEDLRIRIDSDKLNVNANKTDKEILIEHQFSRIDYTKNAFLQKESHEFSYSLKQLDDERYEIFLKSTCPEAEMFVKQINVAIQSADQEESYLHEILLAELNGDLTNSFFDELLKHRKHKISFESALSVKMQINADPTEGNSISPSLDAIVDEESDFEIDSDSKSPKMKSLSVSGTNILEHSDVKDLLEKGFCVRSVSGIFSTENTHSTTLKMTVSMEFNQYGKFQSEIKKSWLVLHNENYKEQRYALSNYEKEDYLSRFNNAAFEVYDSVKQKTRAKKLKPKKNDK